MRVMGIDPGSTVTAWGVVSVEGSRVRYVGSGYVRTNAQTPMPERLTTIHAGVVGALAEWAPTAVAIEAIFAHKSAESALRLGQARGVAVLAVGQAGLPLHEYNASVIKQTVGASGRADKDGITRMIRMLLGVTPDGPADVCDALAIAITHSRWGPARALRAPSPA
jgi:crossover junction endodeoxyribonuclease RuvC